MDTSSRLLAGFFLCLFVFMGAWYDTVHMHSLTVPINAFIQQHITASSTPTGAWSGFYHEALTFINIFGKEPLVFLATALLLMVLIIKKEWKAVLICLVIGFVIMALALLAKETIFSPRPFPFEAEHDSFPSGHTVRSSVWCGLYLLMDRLKYISLSRLARWGFVLIPLLVGFCRLGLGRHWFSDLMAAYALVIGIFFLFYWLILHFQYSKT